MGAVLSVISSVLIVTMFAGLFCIIGRVVLEKMEKEDGNCYYSFAGSYFIGMAVYLSMLRTLTLVIPSYRIVFWGLLIVSAVFAVIKIYRCYFSWISKNIALLVCVGGLWIGYTFHALLYRLIDTQREGLTPYDGIGTIGSLRYAGIADYFIEQDRIPVLNQSYGQSVLASFSGLFGRDNLCFALTLWLAVSGAFLCLLLYGIFRRYFPPLLSILLTCVVDMGSVSLTLAPIRVVDSDYPLLSSGYTDSVVGVATFFLYLEILIQILQEKKRVNFFHYFVTVCCILYWAMSAPHNICVLFGIGFFFILWLLLKKDYSNAGRAAKLGGVILAGCVLGLLQGGMLTPSGLVDEVSIEGVMTVAGVDEEQPSEGVAIVPVMNYQLSKEPGVLWGLAQNTPYMKATLDCAVEALRHGEWYVLIYCLTVLWWDSIRIIFWPLLGILGVALAACHQGNNREATYWAIAGFGAFAVGYPIAFFISLNAYKWALSRFAMPFYFVGMLFLAVILGRIRKSERRAYRLISVCFIFIILAGQLLDKILIFYEKCAHNDVLSLMKGMVLFADS